MLKERFESRVEKDGHNDCWVWTGNTTKWGYGRIKVRGKSYFAHRLAWEIYRGPIPKGRGHHGICVCHKCDNRLCVNPDHLFLGTMSDNHADMVAKRRHAHGETYSRAKLTNAEVFQIRSLLGVWPQTKIAEKFGISKTLVSYINTRRLWSHLDRDS